MSFDYSTSGLPEKKEWQQAAALCLAYLNQTMSQFGDDGIERFMHNQPVKAARRIIENCDNWSEESITSVLLGPAKGIVVANPAVEAMARRDFGDRTIDLIKAMGGMEEPKDTAMVRDIQRVYMVEALSDMGDQMIGRARIDKHHHVRWKNLREYETNFERIKGESPKLDEIFADRIKQSRDALEKLDRDAAAKKGPSQKPPGM